jgi:hypothetical protein
MRQVGEAQLSTPRQRGQEWRCSAGIVDHAIFVDALGFGVARIDPLLAGRATRIGTVHHDRGIADRDEGQPTPQPRQ